jgi:hypothetical protein
MQDVQKAGISRRTVVKGAAWSVPAIAVAGAAPAMAVSGGLVSFTGQACKLPGNSTENLKSYRFDMVSVNPLHGDYGDVVIDVTGFTFNGVQAQTLTIKVTSGDECSTTCTDFTGFDQICVADNSTITWQAIVGPYADSRNGEATITYDVYDATTCDLLLSNQQTTSGPLNTPPCPH